MFVLISSCGMFASFPFLLTPATVDPQTSMLSKLQLGCTFGLGRLTLLDLRTENIYNASKSIASRFSKVISILLDWSHYAILNQPEKVINKKPFVVPCNKLFA